MMGLEGLAVKIQREKMREAAWQATLWHPKRRVRKQRQREFAEVCTPRMVVAVIDGSISKDDPVFEELRKDYPFRWGASMKSGDYVLRKVFRDR